MGLRICEAPWGLNDVFDTARVFIFNEDNGFLEQNKFRISRMHIKIRGYFPIKCPLPV